MTEDFIQKLMISKQIMDRHKDIPRGNASDNINIPNNIELQSFDTPNAVYNLPEEFSTSSYSPPVNSTANSPALTEDRIQKSKLPDEIKRLMIEHPIQKPESYNPTLSNDIIEKAAKLMNNNKNSVIENKKVNYTNSQNNDLKSLIRETLEEILQENGLLTESETKSNDLFTFRVGKHIFEGKISKIKKVK
jgi:hypothetical protein